MEADRQRAAKRRMDEMTDADRFRKICADALHRLSHPLYVAVDPGREFDARPGGVQFGGRESRVMWADEAPPASLLEDAQDAYEDRRTRYNDPVAMYARIAALWSAWTGAEITPADVIHMLIQMKQARDKTAGGDYDSRLDIAGYANLQNVIDPREKDHED